MFGDLTGALEKLDETSEQMTELVDGINILIDLMREQNEILRSREP